MDTIDKLVNTINSINSQIENEKNSETPSWEYINTMEKFINNLMDELEKIVDAKLIESGL